MSVTQNGLSFEKTNQGYYAIFDASKVDTLPLHSIGYYRGSRTILSRYPLVIVDFDPANSPADGAIMAAFTNSELAGFIYKLYRAGIQVNGQFGMNLHNDIVAAGLYNPPAVDAYSGLKPLDFMVLTRAKFLPEGIGKYLRSAAVPSPPPRPNLWEVADGEAEGRENMFKTIKHIGLWGLLKWLYISTGGISFDEFVKCLKEWLPDPVDRLAYYVKFRNFQTTYAAPPLSQQQIKEFTQ